MIFKVAGLALLVAFSAFLLRGFGWKGVPVFISVAFIGIISYALPYVRQIGGFIGDIASQNGVGTAAASVLKVVGIGYLSSISADVCRELEASSLATAVILIGRIEIIAVVVPYFEEMMRIGGELIG